MYCGRRVTTWTVTEHEGGLESINSVKRRRRVFDGRRFRVS